MITYNYTWDQIVASMDQDLYREISARRSDKMSILGEYINAHIGRHGTMFRVRPWLTWDGPRYVDAGGHEYVGSTEAQFNRRLVVYCEHYRDGCPMPLDIGHAVFRQTEGEDGQQST